MCQRGEYTGNMPDHMQRLAKHLTIMQPSIYNVTNYVCMYVYLFGRLLKNYLSK